MIRSLRDSSAPASASASTAVSIQDGSTQSSYRFNPADLSVTAGDTVTWTNVGEQPHNVNGDGLKSKTLDHGDSYRFTFDDAGTYKYICTIHPFMKGTVTVADSTGSTGTGTTTDPSTTTGGTSAASTGVPATGSTGFPSSTAGTAASTGTTSSGSLASTGLDAVLLAEIGVALLLSGAVLRELLLRRRRA